MTTQLRHRACRRVTLLFDGSDRYAGVPAEIVRLARGVGLPAVGVFAAVDGFTADIGSGTVSSPAPIMVIVTGDPESVDDFLEGVAAALGSAEITVADVDELVTAEQPVCGGSSYLVHHGR